MGCHREGTGGVTVDRTDGAVYVVVTGKEIFSERGQGIWKSTDQGQHSRVWMAT
jgi:hypothetical protein